NWNRHQAPAVSIRTLELSPCDTRTADTDFTNFAARHSLKFSIEQVHAVAGGRFADSHSLTGLDVRVSRDHRGLRRTIRVHNSPSGTQPAFDKPVGAGFAAKNEKTQRRHIVLQH